MRRRRAIEVSDECLPRHPRVSVAVVTYNHEQFIAQCLDGVLMQQTTFPFELVIGDDCSTDGTREILLGYQRRHPGVIRLLLQRRNTRGRENLIDTYAACRGDYVAELEGDDYWIDPQKLQLQVDLMDATPEAFLCGARAYVWKDGDDAPYATTPAVESATVASYGARELLQSKWWFRTCTKLYPRHLLQSVPPRYHMDWAETLWLIAKTDFAPLCFLDRVVGVHREHADGGWSAAPMHVRLASDVKVLADVIPVFNGADREYLRDELRRSVGELMAIDAAPVMMRVTAACRAAWRMPGDPIAWRHVAASVTPLRWFRGR